MDWTSDLEISSKKQLIPRLGRRAGHNVPPDDAKFSDEIDSHGSLSSAHSTKAPVAPPRTRKTGWGDDLKSAKSRSGSVIEQEKFRKASKDDTCEVVDIPVIPDIEDIPEDNVFTAIANAPSVGINRVAAYKELNTDLKNTSFAVLDDINLSLLTTKMYPEKLVQEPDEVWTWDQLFTQVSSELNNETEARRVSV